MRKMLALAVAATSWASCAPAAEQDAGFYAGLALGQTRLTDWCNSAPGVTISACEDSDTGRAEIMRSGSTLIGGPDAGLKALPRFCP